MEVFRERPRRRTVEDLQRREDARCRTCQPNHLGRTRYREPTADEVCFASTHHFAVGGCLTHLTRFVTEHYKADGTLSHLSYEAQCGNGVSQRKAMAADGEFFGCHRCITMAEKHGLPTFNLVPSTGCEVSEGTRWKGNGR